MSVPKDMGRDCELSTTGHGPDGRPIPPWEVTRAVLSEIGAAFEPHKFVPWSAGYWGPTSSSGYSTDTMRFWTPNGQCYYSDMSHVEVCTAETRDPRLYAAQCISTLLVAEEARRCAEASAEEGTQYQLSTANVDSLDPAISWGTHVNVAVTAPLWEELFVDPSHPATLGFVSSAIAAAIVFFGTGYLLPMKDGSVVYSPSARAHHLSLISTLSTTEAYGRGLLNSRREPHGEGQERLHLIGFDFALIGAALQSCFLQCCLAAAEEGFCGPNLYAPLQAMQSWTRNLDIERGVFPVTAALVDRRKVTLPGYVRELTSSFLELYERGVITEGVAPGAGDLLRRILDLTESMEHGAIDECARSLDWAAKLRCLIDVTQQEGVELGDPTTRLLDHDFANTNPERGLFWQLWKRGLVDPLVERHEVEACLVDGPPDNRGWGRGRLIQKFAPMITGVDWSHVDVRLGDSRWGSRLRLEMPRPDSLCRSEFGAIMEGVRGVNELEGLLKSHRGIRTKEINPMDDIRSQLVPVPRDDQDPHTHRFPETPLCLEKETDRGTEKTNPPPDSDQ